MEQEELTFVNISSPFDIDGAQRQLVRSRATAASHRDPSRKLKTSAQDQHRRRKINTLRNGHKRDRTPDVVSPEVAVAAPFLFDADDRRLLARRVSGDDCNAPLRILYLVGGHTDPFEAFPVPALQWFSWVLDYYTNVHLPPGMALIQRSQAEGQAYISWHMREAMSEPSFFYMQLLNACTPLAVQGRVAPELAMWVRGQLIASLNEAMGDSTRALSTANILTVASIALHERLYGDHGVAIEVHGRALSRLLAMRSGLGRLELPRICYRLLLWVEEMLAATDESMESSDLLAAWAPKSVRQRHSECQLAMTCESPKMRRRDDTLLRLGLHQDIARGSTPLS